MAVGRWGVFVLTFTAYASIHGVRKSLSNVKTALEQDWGYSSVQLGGLDAAFLYCYAGGLFVSGRLGDRFPPLRVLVIGMLSSALVTLAFAAVLGAPPTLMAFLWGVCGLFQSTGWPTTVAVMGNWFTTGRGRVFGAWAANGSVGNIMGSLLVSACFAAGSGVAVAMVVPAFVMLCAAFVVYRWCPESPRHAAVAETVGQGRRSVELGDVRAMPLGNHDPAPLLVGTRGDALPVSSTARLMGEWRPAAGGGPGHEPVAASGGVRAASGSDVAGEGGAERSLAPDSSDGRVGADVDVVAVDGVGEGHQVGSKVGMLEAICVPGVVAYALSFAMVKLITYSLVNWLPYYLEDHLHYSQTRANVLSNAFDAGQVVGGFGAGVMADRLGFSAPVLGAFLFFSSVVLSAFQLSGDPFYLVFLMAATGFLVGGVANLMSSAVSADLGTHESLRGRPGVMSTITGFIDGTGSFGAATGQLLVPFLSHNLGWNSVFWVFAAAALVAMVCIARPLRRELLLMRARRYSQLPDPPANYEPVEQHSHDFQPPPDGSGAAAVPSGAAGASST